MNLFHKLFGLNLRDVESGAEAPAAGGGAVDRGDSFTPTGTPAPAPAAAAPDDGDDLKVALGEDDKPAADADEQPRGDDGKFVKKDKEATIPKSRFDDAVRKERERAEAAERRLAEIEQQRQQVSRTADISALEQEVKELRAAERKALINGDDKEAGELADKADRLNRQIAIEQARDMTTGAKEQAREEIRMELVIERIETEYPALDEKSEAFDQDLTDDVLDKQRGYIERERLSPSKALLKAVEYVMKRQAASAAAPEPAGKGLSQADKGTERKEAAVKKNVDAATRQPASTKQVGADSDKFGQTGATPEADAMSYEEFSALPESTKAKMRGDFVS